MNKNCIECNNSFETKYTREITCSETCKRNRRLHFAFIKNKSKRDILLTNEDDFVECKICQTKLKSLSYHVNKVHNITTEQYKQTFLVTKSVCKNTSDILSEKIKGDKNPGFQHGGLMSPWSEKSKYHNKEQSKEIHAKAKANVKKENRSNTLEYYTSKGMTLDEATKARSERQGTFSLEKCIKKHGEEKGKQVFSARQEKWHKSFVKSNFSKISQELFWEVIPKVADLSSIYFAQLGKDKTKDLSGKNNEYILRFSHTSVKPDYIDLKKKKIIEFDGDYWHNKPGAPERDIIRNDAMITEGYQVLHIAENLFRSNKTEAINLCRKFLGE